MALGVRPVWAASSVAVRLTCVEYSSEITSRRAAWASARIALGSVISTFFSGRALRLAASGAAGAGSGVSAFTPPFYRPSGGSERNA
ncbi:hypothetical protein D9M72_426970 [compost metagenome]